MPRYIIQVSDEATIRNRNVLYPEIEAESAVAALRSLGVEELIAGRSYDLRDWEITECECDTAIAEPRDPALSNLLVTAGPLDEEN